MLCKLLTHPRVKFLSISFFLACGLFTFWVILDVSSTRAAGIISTDPITNEVGVDLAANIEVTYSSPVSPTTVTTHTFVVQGMLSGARDGVFNFGDGNSRVTLNPENGYFPGEVVRVSATDGISSTGGTPVTSYQWQFTAGPILDRHFDGFADIHADLLEVACGSVAWGDYDNDGDLDILLTGAQTDSGYIPFTRIYRNDGGSFTDIQAGLPDVMDSSVAWGDYDNDGDLDILLTGTTGSTLISRVYRNDRGTFTEIRTGLPGVTNSSVAWGDYDNDGDLDILLTGNTAGYLTSIASIYRNDGGNFTDIGVGLPDVMDSSAAWGDYDNDGDLDILLTGLSRSGWFSQVYRNYRGTFTDIGAGLPEVYQSSVAWGDYDNDGDLDILLTGRDIGNNPVSRVYRNDRGTFTDIEADLVDVWYGSVAWGDFDNDGDLDILLTGAQFDSDYIAFTRIYRNDFGRFIDINAVLPGVFYSSVAWGDYDGDGDLDILFSGFTGSRIVTRVYSNEDYIFYLPVICRKSVDLPDLVVSELVATTTEVRVMIRNVGNRTTSDDFWVDVSFNPYECPPQINQPWPQIASAGVVWGVTRELAAGESLELVTGGDYYWASESSGPPYPVGADVWAYVDSVDWSTTWGAVREIKEENNTRSTVSGVGTEGVRSLPLEGQKDLGNLPAR